MGKKTAEEYFVQRGGKWVPIDMGDDSEVLGSSKGSRGASEEYYVRRGEKWVKISGARSKDDLVAHLGGGGQQSPASARAAYHQEVRTVIQPPPVVQTVVQPAPQEPLEYREYFITVNPRPPERVENEYVERPPPPRQLARQRLPPEPEPIVPQQRPVLKRRPPPPPAPPNVYHIHNHYPPPVEPLPPPLPPPPEPLIMEPHVEWDAFEMGRRAFLEQQAYDEDDDDGGIAGPPRTTPAPGYYLAGYLYYGDPSSAPDLRPLPGM